MAWITAGNIVTTNLDADADSPLSARPNLKAALDEIIVAANGRGQADGVASLDGDTLVPNTQLPNELISSGSNNLTLDPGSSKVLIENFINLLPTAYGSLPGSPVVGDIAFMTTDGAAASKNKLVYHNGSVWLYVVDDSAVDTS